MPRKSEGEPQKQPNTPPTRGIWDNPANEEAVQRALTRLRGETSLESLAIADARLRNLARRITQENYRRYY